METGDYLKQIAEELHTSVMATVDTDDAPAAVIDQAHCIRCGNCFTVCPFSAVAKN